MLRSVRDQEIKGSDEDEADEDRVAGVTLPNDRHGRRRALREMSVEEGGRLTVECRGLMGVGTRKNVHAGLIKSPCLSPLGRDAIPIERAKTAEFDLENRCQILNLPPESMHKYTSPSSTKYTLELLKNRFLKLQAEGISGCGGVIDSALDDGLEQVPGNFDIHESCEQVVKQSVRR